jgi:hypothetical protein
MKYICITYFVITTAKNYSFFILRSVRYIKILITLLYKYTITNIFLYIYIYHYFYYIILESLE